MMLHHIEVSSYRGFMMSHGYVFTDCYSMNDPLIVMCITFLTLTTLKVNLIARF